MKKKMESGGEEESKFKGGSIGQTDKTIEGMKNIGG